MHHQEMDKIIQDAARSLANARTDSERVAAAAAANLAAALLQDRAASRRLAAARLQYERV